jgi:hypothetical protein
MPRSRLLLIGTALAFAAWISYLFLLTRQVERPSIVLSRPQFLVAETVVIAHVESKKDPVTVLQVIAAGGTRIQPGDMVQLANLRDSLHTWMTEDKTAEWDLPNDFIVPLRDVEKSAQDGVQWTAQIVPLPTSPGLPHGTRIYPKTSSTMEQVQAIPLGEP